MARFGGIGSKFGGAFAKEGGRQFGKILASGIPFKTAYDVLLKKRAGYVEGKKTRLGGDVFRVAKKAGKAALSTYRKYKHKKFQKRLELAAGEALFQLGSKERDILKHLGVELIRDQLANFIVGGVLIAQYQKYKSNLLATWYGVEQAVGELPYEIGHRVVHHLALATPYARGNHLNAGRAAAGWSVVSETVGDAPEVSAPWALDREGNARLTTSAAAVRLLEISDSGDEEWTITNTVFYTWFLNKGSSPQAKPGFAFDIAKRYTNIGLAVTEAKLIAAGGK